MTRITALGLVSLVLAGCSQPEVLPTFKSEREKACYLKARDANTDPNTQLRRIEDGFVLTKLNQGFLVSTERSGVFDACMAGSDTSAPNALSDSGTLTFTAKEQNIWDSLSDAEKAEAFAFIRGGGTLTQWAAANG